MTSNNYSTVLKLLTLGFSVIPSGGGDKSKAPLVDWTEWQKRCPDEAQLEQWEAQLHPKLWGIVCGAISGVIVLDADTPEARAKLEQYGLKLHVITPRQGGHFYVNHSGHHIKTSVGILPGLDCRGDGGFVNIIGARPDGAYQIVALPTRDSLTPWDTLPESIRKAIENGKPATTTRTGTRKQIFEGEGRNAMLASEAGRLLLIYKDPEIVKPMVWAYNQAVCIPPVTQEENEKTWEKSLEKWAATGQGTRQDKGAGNDDADKKRPSVATHLVELAGDLELVHSPDSTPYAVMERDGHIETWPLASRAVKDYLARRYHEKTGGAPHSQALQDALNVLRGRALFDGHEELVCVRLAAYDGKLYLDLCKMLPGKWWR